MRYNTMLDIDILKKVALETVSPELYYDLSDNIDDMDALELQAIINCNGDYKKELKLGDIA